MATQTHPSKTLPLAIPMIIANISTPLLGLVDTAVMGHLDSPNFLAGVALGGLIFSFLYWGFSFQRMGTTGMAAQAYGSQDPTKSKSILVRAMFITAIISLTILLSQYLVRVLSFWLIDANAANEQLMRICFG
jgi:MATE family multidrug resistance protein